MPTAPGYHKGLRADAVEPAPRVLAAVDVYVGLTTDRADRRRSPDDEPRPPSCVGSHRRARSTRRAIEAVLAAAGHDETAGGRQAEHPAGLSDREVEVLSLAARGLTTKAIAEELYISPKTADHHIQHVYTKIGVSTRAAAALWAMRARS